TPACSLSILPQRPGLFTRQPLPPAILAHELVVRDDFLAPAKSRLGKTGQRPTVIRAPIRAALHLRRIDLDFSLGIENDHIRVTTGGEDTFARVQAHDLGGVGAAFLDET